MPDGHSGSYRLSGRDILSYGFKYGEPWTDDRRALDRAFRETDVQSDISRRTSSRLSDFGGTASTASTMSTLSSMSSISSRSSTRSGGSTAYQESLDSRGGAYNQAPSTIDVVRIGRGGQSSRGSEQGYDIRAYYPRGDDAGRSSYSDGRRSDYGDGDASRTHWGNGSSRYGYGGESSRADYDGTEYEDTGVHQHHGDDGDHGSDTGTFQRRPFSRYLYSGHHEYFSDSDSDPEVQGEYYERENGYAESEGDYYEVQRGFIGSGSDYASDSVVSYGSGLEESDVASSDGSYDSDYED